LLGERSAAIILIRHPKEEYPSMFKHNRMSMDIIMSLFTCCLLSFCSSAALANTDNRPGQTHADLTVSETVLTSFGDGVPCLRMKIVVRPSQFGGQIPTRLELTTVLNETLHANWRLHAASWAVASNPQVLEEASVRLDEEPMPLGTPVEADFDGLKQSDATYILNLDLRPIEKDESIGSEYTKTTDDQARAKVAARLRQKYKELYKASADEIANRHGVRIWQNDANNP
jgi:hypothetical protein